MSASISKADYLKKYMSSSSKKSEKKAKKMKLKATIGDKRGIKIIDEEIGIDKIVAGFQEDKDVLDTQEDAPFIAGVIDDRSKELKTKQDFVESTKWKRLDPDIIASTSNRTISRPRHDSDSDGSPPRRRHDSGGDISPQRKQQDSNCDQSLPRKQQDSDRDPSPPRRRQDSDGDNSPPRKRQDSDGDMSPPRRKLAIKQEKTTNRRRQDSDGDISPPRRKQDKTGTIQNHSNGSSTLIPIQNVTIKQERVDSDGDLSPVRAPSSSVSRASRTLDGKKAGLQIGRDLGEEMREFQQNERDNFSRIDESVTGRNAATAVRSAKLRRIEGQLVLDKEKEEKKAKLEEVYKKWNKGLKQGADQSSKLAEDLHEMSKPLARMAGDEDLEEMLRLQMRAEDPMAQYMAKKKAKQQGQSAQRPVYRGPAAAPNRFGILPGYRWDGVDRSTGFEKKYFEKKNRMMAIQDEAYQWSVSDM